MFKRYTGSFAFRTSHVRRSARAILILSLLSFPGYASASEGVFLRSLEGNWSGKARVRPRINLPAVNLTCRFSMKASALALSMEGTCKGLLVSGRTVEAKLRAAGSRYRGTYIGPAGGQSILVGSRSGDAIELTVRWSKEVNGDMTADMLIEKIGEAGLRLRTFDRDTATDKTVVTSDIELERE